MGVFLSSGWVWARGAWVLGDYRGGVTQKATDTIHRVDGARRYSWTGDAIRMPRVLVMALREKGVFGRRAEWGVDCVFWNEGDEKVPGGARTLVPWSYTRDAYSFASISASDDSPHSHSTAIFSQLYCILLTVTCSLLPANVPMMYAFCCRLYPEHEITTVTGPVLQAHAPPTLPAGPDERHVRRHDDRHARMPSTDMRHCES